MTSTLRLLDLAAGERDRVAADVDQGRNRFMLCEPMTNQSPVAFLHCADANRHSCSRPIEPVAVKGATQPDNWIDAERVARENALTCYRNPAPPC
jgi:hypothetical protein